MTVSSKSLAIIIVSWNVCDLLRDCLQSIQAEIEYQNLSSNVWVVDNASTDDSVAMLRSAFPWVHLLTSDTNLGFAGGNNTALRAMGFPKAQPNQPEAVLLLNPDTIVQPGALHRMLYFLQTQPEAGVVGARLSFGDGGFQHGAYAFPGLWQLAIELLPLPGRFYESHWNGRYDRALYEGQTPFLIDHPLGAAMMVRREAIHQAGLIDETYHMYVEEVDWSRRIKATGWQAYCVPTAHIIHLEGQSTSQIKAASFINLWHSRYQFYSRYYRGMKVYLARWLVELGMQRKMNQMPDQADTFRKVQRIWRGQEV